MRKQHKAQSSVEFVILITFILIVFTVITIFVQARISEANQVKEKTYINQLKNIIFNEIKIAKNMPVNYTKEFMLPLYIEGTSYNIDIIDGIEVIITYKDREYIYFLTQDFNEYSDLGPGINLITKKKYNSNIVYGFNAQYYNTDCSGYYDGQYCWQIAIHGNCQGKCFGDWDCITENWQDNNCEILENRFKINCDSCIRNSNTKYPAYDEVGETIICYSGTGTATCNAAASGSLSRLCRCEPSIVI